VFEPALALFHDDVADNPSAEILLSIQGTGLGQPAAGSFEAADCGTAAGGAFVVARDALGAEVLRARSTEPAETIAWGEDRIVLRLPGAAAPIATAQVCTASGTPGPIVVQSYAYDHVDIPPTTGTVATPLAVAADGARGVWVNEEFHTQLKTLEPSRQWTQRDLPQAAGPGIFAQTVFGDTPSHIATLGEAITVDPGGRIWLTESGPGPYSGPYANHSRIIGFDPVSSKLDVYAVPGDDNGVIGIGWDEARRRLWFTQARRSTGTFPPAVAYEARLTSFDPSRIAPDATFDFVPVETCVKAGAAPVGTCSVTQHRRCIWDHDCVLAERVCPPATTDDGACFHEYELPAGSGVVLPSHLLVHSDGSIWYSAYWGGNHLGRLDPATGEISRFPLPDPAGKRTCDYAACNCFAADPALRCPTHCCQYLLLGWGPWSLLEGDLGSVVVCGQTSLSVARLDLARATTTIPRSRRRSATSTPPAGASSCCRRSRYSASSTRRASSSPSAARASR
jgi:streptogramin lyase